MMTDSQPDSSPPVTSDKPISVGNVLREKRIGMSLSITDVAHRLKFAPRQVEALEADDFSHLPEITFVRGFVRSYAKLLQLDSEPLLAALPGTPVPAPPLAACSLEEVPFPSASEARKPNLIWLAAAALIVVVAVAIFVWPKGGKPDLPAAAKPHQTELAEVQPAPQQPASAVQDTAAFEPAAAPPQAVPQPAQNASKAAQQAAKTTEQVGKPVEQASKPAQQAANVTEQASKPVQQIAATEAPQPSASPKRPGIIRLAFDEESWVEIKDKDDRVLISRVFQPGSEESLNGKAPFTLAIGRSSAVRLTYKGKAVDLTQYSKTGVARLTLE
ncbi:MAG: DUF4115 domain-containing protein [Gallionellaceae bacterium]|nr:DUF4115 domain-containing protein [Gallionellaceae bacterium]